MFQSFGASTRPQDGPPRLAALRAHLAQLAINGALVPRADAHQGEYVAARDDRLAWLTGFTGSAGFAMVLADVAGVFVDGRYRLQVRAQCDMDAFTPVNWPETRPADWLRERCPNGAVIGYDPWLHTPAEIARLETGLNGSGVTLRALDHNPVDAIWPDRPAAPSAPVHDHPVALTGRTSIDKRVDIAAIVAKAGCAAAVLTLPDAICWLLNIRGGDLPRVPVVQSFAILHADGTVDLLADPAKFASLAPDPAINLRPTEQFTTALKGLSGKVWIDPDTVPCAVADLLASSGVALHQAADPCAVPKARKTDAELAGARAAHLRDGAAMVEFLCWLDDQGTRLCNDPDHAVTEIDIVRKLEACRVATGCLRDISFDTIAGSGPNGAIVHYRVTEATNRRLQPGDLMLVDSGGQYVDGTTDITRTIAFDTPHDDAAPAFTRVLQGMIAISRARFPRGVAGAHLDALARFPLWLAGQDYDHGTGHGVGAYLSVHEGPQRLSRLGKVVLEPGMILSNEPGYYREGAFGIRIENLIAVHAAPPLPGADDRPMLGFETLTLAPIDRRLIRREMLCEAEIAWLDSYHARVHDALSEKVAPATAIWLKAACAPL